MKLAVLAEELRNSKYEPKFLSIRNKLTRGKKIMVLISYKTKLWDQGNKINNTI